MRQDDGGDAVLHRYAAAPSPPVGASGDEHIIVDGQVVSVAHLLLDDDGGPMFAPAEERGRAEAVHHRASPHRRWTLPAGADALVASATLPVTKPPAMPTKTPPKPALTTPPQPHGSAGRVKKKVPAKKQPAPEAKIGVKIFLVPPTEFGIEKPMPGVISEVGEGTVRVEFADKRNLGRQDIPIEWYLEHASPRKK